MEYTQNAKVSIEQRVAFLEKKNEALLVENNFLKEQNSKFSNEIEVSLLPNLHPAFIMLPLSFIF